MPKDTYESKQVVRIIDLLSEGEIEGFPSASGLTKDTNPYFLASLKDTFFNNTPVLAADATVTSNSTKDDPDIVENFNLLEITLRTAPQSLGRLRTRMSHLSGLLSAALR